MSAQWQDLRTTLDCVGVPGCTGESGVQASRCVAVCLQICICLGLIVPVWCLTREHTPCCPMVNLLGVQSIGCCRLMPVRVDHFSLSFSCKSGSADRQKAQRPCKARSCDAQQRSCCTALWLARCGRSRVSGWSAPRLWGRGSRQQSACSDSGQSSASR